MNNSPILTQALNLKYFDKIRTEKGPNEQLLVTVRKCQTIGQAILQFLHNLYEFIFKGGKAKLDNETFDLLWKELEGNFETLEEYFTHLEGPTFLNVLPFQKAELPDMNKENFEFLQKLLQLEGIIKGTKWGKSLKNNANFKHFSTRLSKLQKAANFVLLENPGLSIDPEVKRWIKSNLQQRTFRVMTKSGKLPYLYSEIPKGAVLLTNLNAYKALLFTKGFSLTFSQRLCQLKKYIYPTFTGKSLTGARYTHAMLSLGEGKVFHQKIDGFFKGKGYTEDFRDKVCFQDIFTVQKDISQDWDKLEKIIYNQEIKISALAMLRLVISPKRPVDYTPPSAFDPNLAYACSAVVGVSHGILGIDVGKQFHKRAEDLSLGNLANFDGYEHLYASGL